MQRVKAALLASVIISIATIVTGGAYAQSDNTDSYTNAATAGLNSGVTLSVSGSTVLPGLLLSLFSVWNKNITGSGQGPNGKEKVDPRKLFINILLGIVVGVALNVIGISTNTINANTAFLGALAVTATNYMFLHFTNLALRPVFGHLVQFLGSYAKSLGKDNKAPGTE